MDPALKIATPEVTVGLHMADHGLDCGAASELTFHAAEVAAPRPRDEDAM